MSKKDVLLVGEINYIKCIGICTTNPIVPDDVIELDDKKYPVIYRTKKIRTEYPVLSKIELDFDTISEVEDRQINFAGKLYTIEEVIINSNGSFSFVIWHKEEKIEPEDKEKMLRDHLASQSKTEKKLKKERSLFERFMEFLFIE
jgi:hypothetical protein